MESAEEAVIGSPWAGEKHGLLAESGNYTAETLEAIFWPPGVLTGQGCGVGRINPVVTTLRATTLPGKCPLSSCWLCK